MCYRIAHWKYSYTRPGGHHFGGADLAVFEAFTYALILGPLFGIGLTLLMTLQINEFRKRKGRVIVGLILICIPIVRFTFDVISYR